MKVSSLFNPDKIKEERKKFKEYQELMGIGNENDLVELENDIGTPGELYEGASFGVDSRWVMLEGDKDLEVAYISKNIVSFIHDDANIRIKKCYIQPTESAVSFIRYNLGSIEELHIDAGLFDLNRFNNGAIINKVIIYGDWMDSARWPDRYRAQINTFEYDKDVKFIGFKEGAKIEFNSWLYKRIFKESREVERFKGDILAKSVSFGRRIHFYDAEGGRILGGAISKDLTYNFLRELMKEFIKRNRPHANVNIPYYHIYYDSVLGFKDESKQFI